MVIHVPLECIPRQHARQSARQHAEEDEDADDAFSPRGVSLGEEEGMEGMEGCVVDDSFYPTLGYLCGLKALGKVPVVRYMV